MISCLLYVPSILVHDVSGDTLVSGGDGGVDLDQEKSDDSGHVLVVTTGVLNVTILQRTYNNRERGGVRGSGNCENDLYSMHNS